MVTNHEAWECFHSEGSENLNLVICSGEGNQAKDPISLSYLYSQGLSSNDIGRLSEAMRKNSTVHFWSRKTDIINIPAGIQSFVVS